MATKFIIEVTVDEDDPSEEALRNAPAPEPPSEEAARPAPERPSEEAAPGAAGRDYSALRSIAYGARVGSRLEPRPVGS